MPYFFRIPFPLFLDSLKLAHPEFSVCELCARAQCQLKLELYSMWRGGNSVSWTLDPNPPQHLRDPQLGEVRDAGLEERKRYFEAHRQLTSLRKSALREIWEFIKATCKFTIWSRRAGRSGR